MEMDRRRVLTISGAALTALAVPGVARARLAPGGAAASNPASPGLDAWAERRSPDLVHLGWDPAFGPVQILGSSDADAPAALMRVFATRARAGGTDLTVAASPRPYFLLKAASGERRVAERLLPLEGGRNFRDLGGYRGADGRQVRWGRIYRSGVMSALTAEDLTYLAGLGIRTVCDFRSVEERGREPSLAGSVTELVTFDYAMDYSDIGEIVRAPSREAAITAFSDGYIGFAQTLTPHITDVFQRLLRREAPLAFNCSAGKDRTGLMSALILSVLGVNRADIVADYALSERFVPPETYLAALRGEGPAAATLGEAERAFFAQMPEPVARVLLGTPAEVMEQTLARLDAEHGGPVTFVKARTGLSDTEVDYLRATYLYPKAT